MANAVKGALVSKVWFWMTYVPYTGQDYKDMAADDYCNLRELWSQYVSESEGPRVESGISCPRWYTSSDKPRLAWETVKHRFLRQMASLSLAEVREVAKSWFHHYKCNLSYESEYHEEIRLEYDRNIEFEDDVD